MLAKDSRYGAGDIDALANHYEFLDICYLLLNGELPTSTKALNLQVVLMHTPWCMSKFTNFIAA